MQLAKLNADNSQGKKNRKSPLSKKWQAIQRQLNQNANVERKSLSKTTFHELGDFIESEIENITGNPFVEQSIVKKRFGLSNL